MNDNKKPQSAAEKMAQARREIEEREALERLNIVWGLRGIVATLMTAIFLFFMFAAAINGAFVTASILVVGVTFFLGELIAIIGYFKRKPWCVLPLHVFAAIGLLNMPIGTILSAIHFFSINSVRFDKQ